MPTSTVAERPAAACLLLRGAVPADEANVAVVCVTDVVRAVRRVVADGR